MIYAASTLVYDNGGNYISVRNQPYLMTGIQLRPDNVIEQHNVSTEEDYKKYIEPCFSNAAALGYKTVLFPIHWKQIELEKNVYDFTLLQRYYGYAKKYNLDVQLLWFGSDVCGFNTNIPSYILDDTETYSRLSRNNVSMDYSDEDLVERECLVFQKLLQWLAENDTEFRTVAIQLENEPNAGTNPTNTEIQLPSIGSVTTDEDFDSVAWCTGQKDAILNIINKLGMLVKTGPYRCITRVNLVTHTYLWKSNDRLKAAAEEVLAGGGVDIVGYDTYQAATDTRVLDSTDCFDSIEGNIAHWAEFGAYAKNHVPAMLIALSKRAGIYGYQLNATTKNPTGAIFNDNTGETWEWSTGEAVTGSYGYRVDAYELKAVNLVVNKAGEKIILNDVNHTAVFNSSRDVSCNETCNVGDISITFKNSETTGFGGCGYATKISENEMLIFATRGNSNFAFEGKTITSAESGSYASGVWTMEAEIAVSDSSIAISSDMVNAGTLIRVTFE